MTRFFPILLLLILPLSALAQVRTTATQTISLEIRPVALLEVSGDPQPMHIAAGQAGLNTLDVFEESSTSYRLTTNASNMKLSVAIDEPVPGGTRLYIEMAGTTGTSAGKVEISNALSPVDAVIGIDKSWGSDQSIVYTFEADADRQAMNAQSRTIILTLTN